MISGLLEKLSKRKTERDAKSRNDWAAFVVQVADGKLSDPDAILTQLEERQRTPEELQNSIDLLHRRREWAKQASAGDAAETEYPKLMQQQADAEKALQKMIEEHNAKQEPLQARIENARAAISNAGTAKRSLIDTVSADYREVVFAGIDDELAAAGAAVREVEKRLSDRKAWIQTVESRGDAAATSDVEKLDESRKGLKGMQAELDEAREKLAAVQGRKNALFAKLLLPESI